MWSWLDLVGYTTKIPFICPCSLSPASTEKQPDKIHQKKQQNQKTKTPKENNQNLEFDKSSLFWGFLVCFFPVCSGIVFLKTAIFFMLFGSKAWYTKRFKTNSLQSFLAREKKKSQKCMKGRGDRPTPP